MFETRWAYKWTAAPLFTSCKAKLPFNYLSNLQEVTFWYSQTCFGWSITLTWLNTPHLNWLSKRSEGWTVSGSVSHIDAKYTLWNVKKLSDCSHFSVMSLVKLNDFSFCSELLIKQYFGIWSSVYLKLLQYFILFLLPLHWWTTLVMTEYEMFCFFKECCTIFRKCMFMLILITVMSYILNPYWVWMILVFICMNMIE